MDLKIGGKLYSYAYGPMTIIGVTDRYVGVLVDDVVGISDAVPDIFAVSGPKTFLVDSIGHWIFLDESDVLKKENNDFAFPTGQLPLPLIVTPPFIHARYSGKTQVKKAAAPETVRESEKPIISSVTAKKNSNEVKPSSVTSANPDDITKKTGEVSPVTAKPVIVK